MKPAAILIALLASPAAAATLHPIVIEECVWISAKDMAEDRVERVDYCRVPDMPENPFDFDLAMLSKVEEIPVPPVTVTGPPAQSILPVGRGSGRVTGGTFTFPSLVSVPPFYTIIVREPPRTPVEQPAPIPLPASAVLFLTALAGLYGLRRMKR